MQEQKIAPHWLWRHDGPQSNGRATNTWHARRYASTRYEADAKDLQASFFFRICEDEDSEKKMCGEKRGRAVSR